MILFLIQFLFLSPVQAQTQAVNTDYCLELQPEVAPNGLPAAVSIDVSMNANVNAKCKDGSTVTATAVAMSDLCTMTASCTTISRDVNDIAIKLFQVDFSKLSDAQKDAVMRQASIQLPIHFFPSTLVCAKKDAVVNGVKQRVCKRPDECRLPESGIVERVAQFEPQFFYNQGLRKMHNESKFFPIDNQGAVEPTNSGKQ